jgi:hypothetical protein
MLKGDAWIDFVILDCKGAGAVALAGVADKLTGVDAGVLAAGLPSKGAPTAMSQRCPGKPCFGLRPVAVFEAASVCVVLRTGVCI